MYKYGSVTSVQTYYSYFSNGEENHKYVKTLGGKQLAGKGLGTTAFVSTDLPARTKILILFYSLNMYILFKDW